MTAPTQPPLLDAPAERVAIKGLSLTEPWATLVACGEKSIETRSWQIPYRGLVAIHAAKGMPVWAEQTCYEEPFFSTLRRHLAPETLRKPATAWFPRGCIVAVARIVACEPTRRASIVGLPALELAFGDYSLGRYMWRLEDVRCLPEPMPCKGALGLWSINPEIAARLLDLVNAT